MLIETCSSSEDHLRGIFAQFGLVQTCIVNVDKRHAFVKMLTRQDSIRAKEGMERYKSPDMQLRVSVHLAPSYGDLATHPANTESSSRLGGALVSDRATAATIKPA